MKMPNKHSAPSGRRPTLRMNTGGQADQEVFPASPAGAGRGVSGFGPAADAAGAGRGTINNWGAPAAMGWAERNAQQNLQTSASSIVKDSTQQAAAAALSPKPLPPTGPASPALAPSAATQTLRTSLPGQGISGKSLGAAPAAGDTMSQDQARIDAMPKWAGPGARSANPGLGYKAPAAAPAYPAQPTGVRQYSANSFGNFAAEPARRNVTPTTENDLLMGAAALRSGQAPDGWRGQNLGFMQNGGELYMKAVSLRDGGPDMTRQFMHHTGHGGPVPGEGEGDKTKALYEKGEFVVSNDMLRADPDLREELHELRERVLAAKGMTPEEADAKAVGGKTLRAWGGFGGGMPNFDSVGAMFGDGVPRARASTAAYDAEVVKRANDAKAARVASAATEAAKAAEAVPKAPGVFSRMGTGVSNALRSSAAPVAVAEGGWQATKAAANTLNNMSDDNLGMMTNAGGGDDTAFAAAILNEGRKTTASGKEGWKLPAVLTDTFSPKPVAQQAPTPPAAAPIAAPVVAPTGDTSEIMAGRKAERDNLTLRDANFASSMQENRMANDAAGYANQAAIQAMNERIGSKYERDLAKRNAETGASSIVNDGARATARAELASLHAQELEGVKQNGESLRNGATVAANAQRDKMVYGAQMYGHNMTAKTAAQSALRDQWNKDREFGETQKTNAQTRGQKAAEQFEKDNQGFGIGKDGVSVVDPALTQARQSAVRRLIPGIDNMSADAYSQHKPEMDMLGKIYDRLATNPQMGLDKLIKTKGPNHDVMPDISKATIGRQTWLGGKMTPGSEPNGYYLTLADGTDVPLGQLSGRELEVIRHAAKTGSWRGAPQKTQ